MPATFIQEQNNRSLRERVMSNLQRLSAALHGQAHEADTIREESVRESGELSRLETENVDVATASITSIVGYYLALGAIPAVYVLDVFLFGGVAILMAKIAYPGNDYVINATKLLVPAAIIIFELLIGHIIFKSKELKENSSKDGSGLLWIAGISGVLLALVMPTIAISTNPYTFKYMNTTGSAATQSLFIVIGLALLAFIIHAATIFNGYKSASTLAYFYFRLRRSRLRERVRQLNLDFDRLSLSVVGNWNAYSTEIETYNQRHPDTTIAPLNFDPTTRSFIEECITGAPASEVQGAANLSAPHDESGMNGNAQGQPATEYSGNAPFEYSAEGQSQNGSNNGRHSYHEAENGENEFLRSVLTRRIRDAEDEVN